MKKLSIFLSLGLFALLVGCSDQDTKRDKPAEEESIAKEDPATSEKNAAETSIQELDLAQDYSNYIDAIILLAPEEERIIGLYDNVTGANYTNDEVLYYTLFDEVLPGYRQFVADLESIMPKNPRIRELHELYIEAANIQYNSFTLMISALENQNMDTMTEANQGLDQARSLLRDWLYEVEAISTETGIELLY